jgi:hypothetical protein
MQQCRNRPGVSSGYSTRGVDHGSPVSRNRRFRYFAFRRTHREPRLQPGSSTDVHRRCVSPLQYGNPELIKDYGMHDEAACKPQRRLPDHYGPRPRSAIENDYFELILSQTTKPSNALDRSSTERPLSGGLFCSIGPFPVLSNAWLPQRAWRRCLKRIGASQLAAPLCTPLQLPLASMRLFAIRPEHPLPAMVHRPQHTDTRVQQRASPFRSHDQLIYNGLPVGQFLLGRG